MRVRVADRPEMEPYGLRGSLLLIGTSLLLLVFALALLRLAGWFVLGAYAFGLWGLAGVIRGVADLAHALGLGRH